MEDKNLKGALFPDSDAVLLRKGTITIDGDKKYVSLIKAKTRTGDDILEISVSSGRVFINKQEDKKNEKGPDLSGKIIIDGKNYSFGGWKNVSSDGVEYIGVSMQNNDEDIPF